MIIMYEPRDRSLKPRDMLLILLINVGVDDTDHVYFHCPACDEPLIVQRVITKIVVVRSKPIKKDKCTWIHLKCQEHGNVGCRKFYWSKSSPIVYPKGYKTSA